MADDSSTQKNWSLPTSKGSPTIGPNCDLVPGELARQLHPLAKVNMRLLEVHQPAALNTSQLKSPPMLFIRAGRRKQMAHQGGRVLSVALPSAGKPGPKETPGPWLGESKASRAEFLVAVPWIRSLVACAVLNGDVRVHRFDLPGTGAKGPTRKRWPGKGKETWVA